MHGFCRTLLWGVGVLLAASCVGQARDARSERADVPHAWVKLATRTVDFSGDHDVIEVGGEGRFTAIRFTVDQGDLAMDHIKVVFRNGEVFEPNTRAEFREGTRSRDIDLPGDARYVRRVEFYYRSIGRHARAVVNLYGRLK
jgi:hypothetical protein